MRLLRDRKLGLQARLVGTTLGLISTSIVLVSGFSISRQNSQLQAVMEGKREALRSELGKRGMAVARNIALSSQRAIAVKNFLFLAEIIETTVHHDKEIVYGMIMNRERRVLIHSDAHLAGQQLTSPNDMFAAQQTDVAAQEMTVGLDPVLEVVAPIEVLGKSWGSVRLGFSLKNLNDEVRTNQENLRAEVQRAVLTNMLVALAMMVVGTALTLFSTARIMVPMRSLMEGVRRIHGGDVAVTVVAKDIPEFVGLASAFNEMTYAVKKRETDLAGALEEARDASRHKSEFIATISHELRTPLNALLNIPPILLSHFKAFTLWVCAVCKGTYEPSDKAVGGVPEKCPQCAVEMTLEQRWFYIESGSASVHFIQRLAQSGAYLLRVIDDLLDFTKLEAGKMQIYSKHVDLSGLQSELGATLESLAAQKELTIRYSGFAGLSVKADPVKLQQVLTNLIGNAIKFTGPKGTISVRCAAMRDNGRDCVSFAVEDTGIGIPKERFDAIFESFRQVDGSHTRAHQGTGLGLTIAKQLIELHGGRIWVASEIGEGSTFTFLIPRDGVSEPRTPSAPGAPAPLNGGNLLVLLVDDDRIQASIAGRILTAAGYKIDIITDSQIAMARALAVKPDVILLDVMMPYVSGLTILRQLKEQPETRHIPVVVSTAYHSNHALVTGLGGIWLPKPWAKGALENALAVIRADALRSLRDIPADPGKRPA